MLQKFSIKFIISTVIVSMVTFIALLLTYLHYENSTKSSYELLEKLTSTASKNILNKTVEYLHQTNKEIKFLADSNVVNDVYVNKEANIAYMTRLMETQRQVSSIYIADVNGGFLQVKRNIGLVVFDKLPNYDPRNREWFINANESIQITSSYNFYSDGVLGFTAYYANFDKDGNKIAVVGVDISLDTLTKFIKAQAKTIDAQIIVINNIKKLLILSSSSVLNNKYHGKKIDEINDIFEKSALILATKSFLSGAFNGQIELENGMKYLYGGAKSKVDNSSLCVVLSLHEDVVLGSLKQDMQNALNISLFILIIFIFIAIRISSIITKPISNLSKEIYELKQLNTDIKIQNDSKISEISSAQNSLSQLHNAMDSFKKYMPLELVSKLIQSNTPVKIGGEEKELVVMFTDIQGFTTISENMTPTELTNQLSEYFGHMQEIIGKYEGTVDKYIGDAIMAFWGAPLEVQDPVLKAVLCAIEMQKKLDEVNEAWKKESKAELTTRIGLHYGLTLVGNIGSKERMNYTIMGDSVNIAARLENINKSYGTKIMISESVNDIVKETVITKYIDEIELKGKSKSTKIYTVMNY